MSEDCSEQIIIEPCYDHKEKYVAFTIFENLKAHVEVVVVRLKYSNLIGAVSTPQKNFKNIASNRASSNNLQLITHCRRMELRKGQHTPSSI